MVFKYPQKPTYKAFFGGSRLEGITFWGVILSHVGSFFLKTIEENDGVQTVGQNFFGGHFRSMIGSKKGILVG